MEEFRRIKRLPPYVFAIVNALKAEARARGEDIIDFGMGNPDQPTPQHIVDKLVEVAQRRDTHRYSQSKGIPRLRRAICNWYKERYDVDLDPETEAIVSIGSKEGLAHLALACLGPGDSVLVPNPAYPIHPYGFVIAGGGGGIPVYEDVGGYYRGVEAVIDKDYVASILARDLEADLYIVLTQVPMVAENFGRPNQRWLRRLPLQRAQEMLDANQFPPGSMGPKVRAAIEFVSTLESHQPSMLRTTSAAVKSVPSCHFTPSRSLKTPL